MAEVANGHPTRHPACRDELDSGPVEGSDTVPPSAWPERLKRGPAFDRAIRSLLVVVKTESVELKLEVSLSFLEFKIGRWWGFEGAGTRSVRDLSPLIAAAFAPPPRPLPPSSGH